jgi:hypothetical protein
MKGAIDTRRVEVFQLRIMMRCSSGLFEIPACLSADNAVENILKESLGGSWSQRVTARSPESLSRER